MLGVDDWLSGFSDGTSLWLVVLVAVFLGLRHAADPDHLAAVTTLIASRRDASGRAAAHMGLAWGIGHGTTLFVFGLPIVVFNKYLPERLQQGAETIVAFVIVLLAVRLLYRWRTGVFHIHEHGHDGASEKHAHLHAHAQTTAHAHEHRLRTPLSAFGIGLVHGMGGSAGVSVLLLATIDSQALAVVSLVVLAVFTAMSMMMLTAAFGRALTSERVQGAFNVVAPAIGVAGLAFGVWYAAAAWSLAPYPF